MLQIYNIYRYICIYIYTHVYLYVLEFVAHSVDLLDVGEYQLGVNPTVLRHNLHIVGSQKVVDEGTEGQTISPRGSEVLNLHIIVFPGSALAPDEDSLHLRGHHLRASNSGDS